MAVIDRNLVRGVDGNDLAGPNDRLGHQEWADRFDVEGLVEIALGETCGLVGGCGAPWSLEKAVRAWVGAKIVVKQLVLVKDHEDVLHLLAQKFDLPLKRPVIVPVRGAAVETIPVCGKRHCAGQHSHAPERCGGDFAILSSAHSVDPPQSRNFCLRGERAMGRMPQPRKILSPNCKLMTTPDRLCARDIVTQLVSSSL